MSEDDVVLLVKQYMNHTCLAQQPMTILSQTTLDSMPISGPNGILRRNVMNEKLVKEYQKTANLVEQEPWCLHVAANYLRTWTSENQNQIQRRPPQFQFEPLSLTSLQSALTLEHELLQEFAPNQPKIVAVEQGPPALPKPKASPKAQAAKAAPKPKSQGLCKAKAKPKAKVKAAAKPKPKAKGKAKAKAKAAASATAAAPGPSNPLEDETLRSKLELFGIEMKYYYFLSCKLPTSEFHGTLRTTALSEDQPDSASAPAAKRGRKRKPQTSLGCSKCRYKSDGCGRCRRLFQDWQQHAAGVN